MHRLIVDGFNLSYRAHYAHLDWVTKTGILSGCFYGFMSSLQTLKNRFPKHHFTVAWDTNSTRKKSIFAEYKANRQAFSIDQPIADLKAALSCVNIWQSEYLGEEADDVIASLAAQFNANGEQVLIYSRDKDLLQLVRDGAVTVLWPKVGLSQEMMFDAERVKKEYEVSPPNIPCLLCLRGDHSDNIPGVPRVPTTILARLSEAFGIPEVVYENLLKEKLTVFQHSALMSHQRQASINWQLTKLRTDLDPEISKGKSNPDKLAEWLMKYEVKKISAESFVKLFGTETQFLERRSTPVVFESLFDEEIENGANSPSPQVR